MSYQSVVSIVVLSGWSCVPNITPRRCHQYPWLYVLGSQVIQGIRITGETSGSSWGISVFVARELLFTMSSFDSFLTFDLRYQSGVVVLSHTIPHKGCRSKDRIMKQLLYFMLPTVS